MNAIWESIKRNWKTSLAGVLAFLFSCPTFISAFEGWSKHQAIDWRGLLFGLAMFAVSTGLIAAKDGSNHSTLPEIRAATLKAETEKVKDGQ